VQVFNADTGLLKEFTVDGHFRRLARLDEASESGVETLIPINSAAEQRSILLIGYQHDDSRIRAGKML
jgi:hypothetical protein